MHEGNAAIEETVAYCLLRQVSSGSDSGRLLDETPSLCVSPQEKVEPQSVGVTVLTGGVWYSNGGGGDVVRRWCDERSGRQYVEGWLACNGSAEWVEGSEVEGYLCGVMGSKGGKGGGNVSG